MREICCGRPKGLTWERRITTACARDRRADSAILMLYLRTFGGLKLAYGTDPD